ncbi:MAG: TAXI family TRAP transporter solute-binding subunit [Betaproteobacteria bacterium]|nr:TAXI family TRAP transporter solute-binding subunit [Betaproteobacteria bacterium]
MSVSRIVSTLLLAGALALPFASKAQQTIGFATLAPGSLLHAQASIIAKVVQDHTKMQVRVIGYGGDAGMFDAINTQKADFMILDLGETADAHHGRRNWQGSAKPAIRMALTLYGFQMGLFVRKDSNINTLADLKGKRVPSDWVAQTGVLPHSQAILAVGGLTYNDVVKVPEVNVVRAADDFKSGKLDTFYFAVGAPKVAEVAASVGGVRILPLGDVAAANKAMKSVREEYYPSTANPAPHVVGLDKPTDVITIDFIVGVGSHVKDDIVYEFVKAIQANKAGLVEGHPNFNAFIPDQAGKVQPTLPHHPGAIKFYREKGIWKESAR